jgi:hypothetical protein
MVHLIRVFVPHTVHGWRKRCVSLPVPPQVMHRIGMYPPAVRRPLRVPDPLHDSQEMMLLRSV